MCSLRSSGWVPPFPRSGRRSLSGAHVTGLDGAIDPNITQVTLLRNGEEAGTVPVADGEARVTAPLELGDNEFQLRLEPDGGAVPHPLVSDPIVIERRLHPLDRKLVDVSVTGSGNRFDISITPVPPATLPDSGSATVRITDTVGFDDPFNTTGVTPLFSGNTDVSGLAAGPGEVYVNLDIRRSDGETERRRIAVVIEEDGTAREMRYEETASWVHNAVVYEIFPFSFGPEASSGTPASPGRRFREITRELDYIAEMGFNAIWFMPIMHNQVMNQISGGYNIIDFYNVDPRLGTNADFKALVGAGARTRHTHYPRHHAQPCVPGAPVGRQPAQRRSVRGLFADGAQPPQPRARQPGREPAPKSATPGPIITNTRDSETWRTSTGTTTICKPRYSMCWRSG